MPEREQLAGEIALLLHDALNQLQVARTRTQLAEEQISRGHRAEDRAVALIRQGLELASRLMAPPHARIELNAVIAEVTTDLMDVLPGVEIRAVSAPTKLWTHVDHGALLRALDNLARNAARAMPAGGVLTMSALLQEDGQMVCVRVHDTGAGMDAETLARIWEPGFTTKPPGGTHGLGLYQVRKFVQDHHGTTHVESKPGQGATFELCFPRVLNGPPIPPGPWAKDAVKAVEVATQDAAEKAKVAVSAVGQADAP